MDFDYTLGNDGVVLMIKINCQNPNPTSTQPNLT